MPTIRTFSILTLGCKVNQYESSSIREFLENEGLSWIKPEEKPDMFVVNTCCVTSTASAKSRQYIQRARRQNDQAALVICGCLAAQQPPQKGQAGELRLQESDAIHLVANRDRLASKLHEIIAGARSGCSFTNSAKIAGISQHSFIKPENNQEINTFTDLTSLPKLPLLTSFKEHTRAFLKVQDGCDGTCSYCIVPKVRPNVQSKPIFEAITEAKALVAAGHKEIVVTGVNLGAYGRETVRRTEDGGQRTEMSNVECPILNIEVTKEDGGALSVLLGRLAEVEGLRRIRVSSLEPGDINDQLLDVFCGHKNIMPHIHLSVQSGSDAVLKRMCRPYSAAQLREKIELIKRRLDRPAITCDMIVGFPGETDEDFKETVELARWAGFSKIHVFGFSLREGTAAAKMKDKIQPKVVKMRSEILRGVGEELGFKFREQFVGETCEVLIEGSKDNQAFGHCERYFVVKVKRDTGYSILDTRNGKQKTDSGFGSPVSNQDSNTRGRPCGSIVKVKITAVTGEGAEGEAVG